MTTLILLGADDADAVRGQTLQPRLLTDGRSILNVMVLADPIHAEHRERLAALPTVPLADIQSLMPPDEVP